MARPTRNICTQAAAAAAATGENSTGKRRKLRRLSKPRRAQHLDEEDGVVGTRVARSHRWIAAHVAQGQGAMAAVTYRHTRSNSVEAAALPAVRQAAHQEVPWQLTAASAACLAQVSRPCQEVWACRAWAAWAEHSVRLVTSQCCLPKAVRRVAARQRLLSTLGGCQLSRKDLAGPKHHPPLKSPGCGRPRWTPSTREFPMPSLAGAEVAGRCLRCLLPR
jgi:hypothetical protein